jgi:hypothetical protein
MRPRISCETLGRICLVFVCGLGLFGYFLSGCCGSFFCLRLLSLLLCLRSIGEHLYGDLDSYLLVQTYRSGVVTDLLDRLDEDQLTLGL